MHPIRDFIVIIKMSILKGYNNIKHEALSRHLAPKALASINLNAVFDSLLTHALFTPFEIRCLALTCRQFHETILKKSPPILSFVETMAQLIKNMHFDLMEFLLQITPVELIDRIQKNHNYCKKIIKSPRMKRIDYFYNVCVLNMHRKDTININFLLGSTIISRYNLHFEAHNLFIPSLLTNCCFESITCVSIYCRLFPHRYSDTPTLFTCLIKNTDSKMWDFYLKPYLSEGTASEIVTKTTFLTERATAFDSVPIIAWLIKIRGNDVNFLKHLSILVAKNSSRNIAKYLIKKNKLDIAAFRTIDCSEIRAYVDSKLEKKNFITHYSKNNPYAILQYS